MIIKVKHAPYLFFLDYVWPSTYETADLGGQQNNHDPQTNSGNTGTAVSRFQSNLTLILFLIQCQWESNVRRTIIAQRALKFGPCERIINSLKVMYSSLKLKMVIILLRISEIELRISEIELQWADIVFIYFHIHRCSVNLWIPYHFLKVVSCKKLFLVLNLQK